MDESATPQSASIDEFVKLFEANQRSIFLYIVAMVPGPADAHDVLQETNLVLWRKFDQFERGTNFLAWAREVARYQVLRYRQIYGASRVSFNSELVELLSAEAGGPAAEASDARLAALERCLASLGERDRELIRQRYGAKLPVGTLAQQLGRSDNSVSQSLRRVRTALKECIERRLVREGRDA